MALLELDSFYVTFKNLLVAEKDATLTLKALSGSSHVTLSVDIGHVHTEYAHQPHQTRNGPSRIRRRERRAEARRLAAEAAVSAEKAKATKVAEEVCNELCPIDMNIEDADVLHEKLDRVTKGLTARIYCLQNEIRQRKFRSNWKKL